MSTQPIVVEQSEMSSRLGPCIGIAVIASIVLPMFFWTVWSVFVGPIPTVGGLSRFILDTVGFPFYAIITAICYMVISDVYCELSHNGVYAVCMADLAIKCPRALTFGLFVGVGFAVGIFHSFAVGLLSLVPAAIITPWMIKSFLYFSDPVNKGSL